MVSLHRVQSIEFDIVPRHQFSIVIVTVQLLAKAFLMLT